MTTFGEALKQRQEQQSRGSFSDAIAERDREYEQGSITPPALGGPTMPPGYEERNPIPERPNRDSGPLRGLQLGTQATGAGLGNLAGLPVDLMTLVLDAPSQLINALGGDVPVYSESSGGVENVVGSSSYLRSKAADGVEAALGEDFLIDKADMTPEERLRSAIVEYGTEAAVGGGTINALKTSSAMPRALSAPYVAPGSPTRVLVGDTAAGMGSGALMQSYEEYVPDAIKDRLGVFGQIISGLIGGIGGASLPSAGESLARGARKKLDSSLAVPEDVIPRDPDTGQPITRADRDRAAALYQERAIDPSAAAAEITDYLNSIESGPNPTSALISDDPGLLAVERQQRSANPAPFIEADRSVANSVSEDTKSIRPEDADPAAARTQAETVIGQTLADANERVVRSQQAVTDQDAALVDLAGTVENNRGADQSSRDLDRVLVDETYIPARTEKNRLYEEAAESGAEVPVAASVTEAEKVAGKQAGRKPSTRSDRAASIGGDFSEVPESGTRPISDVMADRQALSSTESNARAQGDFEAADAARDVRTGINEDIRAVAGSGAPGTETVAAADTNYRERFAPYFRDGNAAPGFFRDVDRDPTRGATPPEATAGKFLRAGPTGRAAAEDVAKILEIAPNRAEGVTAARDYVMSDAVAKGVIKDGKINETQLARFIAQREGMLSQLPGLKQEFDSLLEAVRSGNAEASELRRRLDEALTNSKLTERDLKSGALQLVVDADPRKAVSAVLAKKDPVAAMQEITATLTGDALEGWRAAVADYFVGKVTTASKAAVSNQADTVSLPKLRQVFEDNREALAEVFTPEEMSTLEQVQKRLEVMSNRGAQAAGGSSTAENLGPVANLLRAIAGPAGDATMLSGRGAIMAGSVERRFKRAAEAIGFDTDLAAKRLMERAAFDPELARHLLEVPVDEAQMYTWAKKLNQMIVLGAALREEEQRSD